MSEKPRPLTDLDLDVLRAVAAGQVWRSESIGTLYDSFSDADPNRRGNVNRHVKKLAVRKLIRLGGDAGRRRLASLWVITEAGEAELKRQQKGE